MDLKKLSEPFPAEVIHWRIGRKSKDGTKAIPFAYIDARDVMDRLDDVCGPGGWQCRYPYPGCCELSIKIGDEWVTKTNGSDETDIEGIKGQYSKALVRAASNWSIGRYLYDLPNRYFPVGQYGFDDEVIADLNRRYTAWVEKYFKQKEAA